MTDPLISTIIPLYNYEDYIRECVESILNQEYSNLQLILVDNGSTDRSGEIISEIGDPRLEIHRIEENDGWTPAFNLGFGHARGEWIHYFTADDALHPDFYSRLLEEADSDYDLIGAWMQPVDKQRQTSPEFIKLHDQTNYRDFSTEDFPEFAWQCPMEGNSFIGRAELWDRIMPMPNVIPGDWAIIIRALSEGIKARVIQERLFDMRVHGNNLGDRMNQLNYLVHYFYIHLTEVRPAAERLNGRSDAAISEFQEQFKLRAKGFEAIQHRQDIVLRLIAASDLGYDAGKRWPDIKSFENWVFKPDLDDDPAILEFHRIHSLIKSNDEIPDTVDEMARQFVEQRRQLEEQKLHLEKMRARLTRLRGELDRQKEKNGKLRKEIGGLKENLEQRSKGFFRRKK